MERVLATLSCGRPTTGSPLLETSPANGPANVGRAPGRNRKSPIERALKASFGPVADDTTRVLILGSLPGDKSLEWRQYYANPQNQFWRLIGAVIGRRMPDAYEARLEFLSEAGIGLWDVIESARRMGSLDVDIRDHAANPLAKFVAELPSLRAIAFNGGKPSKIGRRQLREGEPAALIPLPSSSSMYAAISFEHKLASWLQLRDYL